MEFVLFLPATATMVVPAYDGLLAAVRCGAVQMWNRVELNNHAGRYAVGGQVLMKDANRLVERSTGL